MVAGIVEMNVNYINIKRDGLLNTLQDLQGNIDASVQERPQIICFISLTV